MPSPKSQQLRAILSTQVAPLFKGTSTLETLRSFLESMGAYSELPPDTRVEKVTIGESPAEWISGPGAAEGRVILFLHGGAYALGSCNSHRELAARIAASSEARCLLIEYRLAPEHPFPAAIDDAIAAYRWLIKSGVKPRGITIAGDSAGGGLTLATLVSLRDAGDPMPADAVLLSPWTDLASTGESHATRVAADPTLSPAGLPQLIRWYLGDRDPRTPLASPLYSELRGLPPLLIHVGNDEILLDDSTRLAERARAAGVDVTIEIWEGMWHVFQGSAATLPEGQESIQKIGAFIRERAPADL